MSEYIDNAVRRRRDLLKEMIRHLHAGEAPEQVRHQIERLLGQVPYDDVVSVEQELMADGVPFEEILRLCDVHAAVLRGAVDASPARDAPPGHPVHTFRMENLGLQVEIDALEALYDQVGALAGEDDASGLLADARIRFHALMDVEKHYVRKENLLFPYLEKHGIDGPPKVMWGKHDETRRLLRDATNWLKTAASVNGDEAARNVEALLRPASNAVAEMIVKEEQILLPMSFGTLSDEEWHDINQQSPEIGYCLYDPAAAWLPESAAGVESPSDAVTEGRVVFPSGSLSIPEMTALFNTLPVDVTFVDRDDTVRFFTQAKDRIFTRSRAIIGRKVQYCHPPSSVGVVDRILDDFREGRHDRAAFWISMHGRFIHIEYFALREPDGRYLGCMEVSQDLTEKRSLTGERRLLSYDE